MEGLELEPGVRWDFPSVLSPSPPYWGWSLIPSHWSRNSKLALFLLSVCFPLSPHQESCPGQWGVGCWSKGSPCGLSAHVSFRQRSKLSPMHCLFWYLQLFPSLCIGATSGASFLCPPQLITAPSLGSPCPVVEPQHRAGRAHGDFWHISGYEMYWSSCLQRSGLLQIHCLSNCQQWPPLPHRFYPQNGSPLCPMAFFSTVMAIPDPVPCCDVEWAGPEHLLILG